MRLAWRRLRRRPGRGLTVALILALGVGALTSTFAATDQVLLRDLPVRSQEELVVAWFVNPTRGFVHVPFRPTTFELLSRGVGSLSAVAGVETAGARPTPVEDEAGPRTLRHVRVAGDFFGVMGVRPTLGRLLRPTDDLPGAAPVLVLSHRAWVGHHGADSSVVGSNLRYGGRSFTVVGVAAEGFDFPRGTEVWATLRGAYPSWADEEPVGIELDLVGRMRTGVDARTVAADLQTTLRSDAATEEIYGTLDPVVKSLEEHVVGAVRPVLRLTLSAAALLLLAAVANTTLLLLAGGSSAAHDVAVRRALGAERVHVVGRPVADATLAAALGLAGGWALAWLALRGILPLAPAELPRLGEVGADGRAFVVALVAALGCAAAAGSAAGWVWTRPDLGAIAASREARHSRSAVRVRQGIAGLQVALAVLTAVGAGLLVRSVSALDRLEPGFDPHGLSVVSLSIPYTYFEVPDEYFTTLAEVARDLGGRAGVDAVLPTLASPLEAGLLLLANAEGQPEDRLEGNPYVAVNAVLPGHTRAMGMSLLAGRALGAGDNAPGADPVVVIDEIVATALWPGTSPLGRRIGGFGDSGAWWTVVGVVASTRYHGYPDPVPAAYYPMRRMREAPPARLLVRIAPGGPSSVRAMVAQALGPLDPRVRVLGEEQVADVLRRPAARPRFAAWMLLVFAGATLVLALTGVYGVFSVWVQERARELGVRKALGAQHGHLVRLVLGGALRVAGVGAATGVVVAWWVTPLLESLLYGVDAGDPGTLVGVAAVAVGAALVAGLIPALRAAGTDPGLVLRTE